MRKFLLTTAAALAAGLCTGAVAAPASYVYTIWNLANSDYTGPFPPGIPPLVDFSGVFAGEDRDADGLIERSEVTLFRIGWDRNEIVPVSCVDRISSPFCDDTHLDSFSYDLRSGAFEAVGGYPGREGADIVTGQNVWLHAPPGNRAQVLSWTDSTYITVRPIPEPASAVLLALGLAGLALRRIRRSGGP